MMNATLSRTPGITAGQVGVGRGILAPLSWTRRSAKPPPRFVFLNKRDRADGWPEEAPVGTG